jgi:hypothetical protein
MVTTKRPTYHADPTIEWYYCITIQDLLRENQIMDQAASRHSETPLLSVRLKSYHEVIKFEIIV